MSFSSEVKDELLTVPCEGESELAFGYGMLLYGRYFSDDTLSLLTEHKEVAEKYADIICKYGRQYPEIVETDGHKYKVNVSDKSIINNVFLSFQIISGATLRRINTGLIDSPDLCSAFIRGVFLVCGTVVDPEKEYHLEFSVPTGGLARDLVSVFRYYGSEFNVIPKIADRNGAHIVYLKKSEDIEDTLTLMGANNKSLDMMGVKMIKDVKNSVNRKVNFENANLVRTAAAAAKQYDAIVKIRDLGKFEELSPELKEIALIRLDDIVSSSAEIAAMLEKPLSVSGVNHRFAKIIKIAEEL